MPIAKKSRLPKPHKGTNTDKLLNVKTAAAYEPTRWAIHGVWIGKREAVATDGRRMFIVKGDFSKETGKEHSISKVLGRIAIVGKKGELTTLERKACFPRYKDLIPVKNSLPITVNLSQAYRDLRHMATMIVEKTDAILVVLNPDGSLGFSVHTSDIRQAGADIYKGFRGLGSLNGVFFLDALKFHAREGATKAKVWWDKPDRPLLMESKGAQSVTMPIHFSGSIRA